MSDDEQTARFHVLFARLRECRACAPCAFALALWIVEHAPGEQPLFALACSAPEYRRGRCREWARQAWTRLGRGDADGVAGQTD